MMNVLNFEFVILDLFRVSGLVFRVLENKNVFDRTELLERY